MNSIAERSKPTRVLQDRRSNLQTNIEISTWMDIHPTTVVVPLFKTALLGEGRREAQRHVTCKLTHTPLREHFVQGFRPPNKLPKHGCVTNLDSLGCH
jgi:hypothetical protein